MKALAKLWLVVLALVLTTGCGKKDKVIVVHSMDCVGRISTITNGVESYKIAWTDESYGTKAADAMRRCAGDAKFVDFLIYSNQALDREEAFIKDARKDAENIFGGRLIGFQFKVL